MIERISELDVERLAHGELSRERAAAVRAALGDHADERCCKWFCYRLKFKRDKYWRPDDHAYRRRDG